MSLSQWLILICGVGAIWLANERSDRLRRWAPVFGLIGQPAWIIAALEAQQLGVLLVSLLYTVAWARGLFVHWISRAIRQARRLG